MPINAVARAAELGHREIVRELANACILYFNEIRGPGNGVGNGSCCAAVRVLAPAPATGAPDYRFGNSQAQYLDADANDAGGVFNPENHAERHAHAAGLLAGGYTQHLFVEMPPCEGPHGCAAWCAATIPDVFVWYLYPTGAEMAAAHLAGEAAQFHALNAALP